MLDIFFRFRLGAKYHLFNLDSVKYFFLGNKMSLLLCYNIFFFFQIHSFQKVLQIFPVSTAAEVKVVSTTP